MAPARSDFGDDYDFDTLLPGRTPAKDTPTSSWDQSSLRDQPSSWGQSSFSDQPSHADRVRWSTPPVAPSTVAVTPRVGATAVARPHSRGQLLGWLALLSGIGCSVLLGYGAFAALDTISVTAAHPLDAASDRMNLVILALVGLVISLVLAILSLFRSRPKVIATLAIVLVVVLPPLALVTGLKYGAAAFAIHAQAQAAEAGVDVAGFLVQLLAANGVDAGPFVSLIKRLFG